MTLMNSALIEAINLILSTPGHAAVGEALAQLASRQRIRIDMDLPDRAKTTLRGIILLGPEAAEASPLSLAQTLVHEQHHLQQNPLLKTVSFWSGIATRTEPMRRYEQPAYQTALEFLKAVAQAHPDLASEARAEQNAIRQVFRSDFGGELD